MLSASVDRYLAFKRALGFKCRMDESLLRNFVRFAVAHGDVLVTSDRASEWAVQAPTPPQRRNRLLAVRRLAVFLQAEDGRHQPPSPDVFGPARRSRRKAHIYEAADIQRLLNACDAMRDRDFELRPTMYRVLFGIIACTGLRVSEALALEVDDVTPDGLFIRETKFRKNRLVPIHPTVEEVLRDYRKARQAWPGRTLFLARTGKSLAYTTVVSAFLHLSRQLGLRGGPGEPGGRIHDLRHSFAVRSLERCAGTTASVSRHVLALSTYLGHAHVSDTYHYLQATPALLEQIATMSEATMELTS